MPALCRYFGPVLLSAPRFALPETVAEAVAALAERPGAAVVAGGTELLPDLLWRHRTAAGFVSLRRVAELRRVAAGPAPAAGSGGAAGPARALGSVVLGAGVTAARLQGPDVAAAAPGLALAAASLGSPLVRAEATIGGNVVSALPYRNLLPVLLALDARLRLTGPAGEREVPFDGFVTAPGRTRLAAGELVTAVVVPAVPGRQDYVKVGRRNAQFVATVSAAVVAGPAGVRLAYGNAAPTPFRHDAIDAAATAGDVAGAVALVRELADPPDDDAAPAAYRRHALGVLTERVLRR
jgi:CO/xanthine dehydrogenase FAD-binding subunit